MVAIAKYKNVISLKSFGPISAIKCTVTDNKTANINDKNCSLSIVLTAVDQKQQKS